MKLFRSVSRNADLRCQMSNRGPQVVDGQGCSESHAGLPRLCLNCETHTFPMPTHFMAGEMSRSIGHFRLVPSQFHWRHIIPGWNGKLRSSDSMIWIANDKSGTLIGTIAVDSLKGETASLAICLCPSQRGRGLGPILIEKASAKLLQEHGVDRILVQFKPGNTASQTRFQKGRLSPNRTNNRQRVYRACKWFLKEPPRNFRDNQYPRFASLPDSTTRCSWIRQNSGRRS